MAFDIVIQAAGAEATDLTAADVVEVCERIGEPTTFKLRYRLQLTDSDFAMLLDGRLAPGGELLIAANINDAADVLCHGQVFGHKVHLEQGVRDSFVEVSGGDKTMEMDRDIKQKVWTGVKVSDAVSSILTPYVDSVTVDTVDVQYDDQSHELVQIETDLRFVRRLARRYGHWFYVSTDSEGSTTAYFQRPILDGDPVVKLKLSDPGANLDWIDIEWDVERPSTAIADQLGLRAKDAISGALTASPLTPLGTLTLGTVATPRMVHVVAPADDAGDLQARSEAALIDGGWFVRARGKASKRGLGAALHTHTVVQLEGAGTRHSGKYVVASVRHLFDAHGHSMDFELIRNAWEA